MTINIAKKQKRMKNKWKCFG